MTENAIEYAPGRFLDPAELQFAFIRASGPGGQNVQKVSSAVQLRFDARASPSLPDAMRARLIRLAGRRVNAAGVLVITAQCHRSQDRNRQDALDRLLGLLREAAIRPTYRVKTRVSLGQKRQRLEEKSRRASTKTLRQRPAD